METERPTQIASMLTDTTSRRGALHFLAGLALAGIGRATLGSTDVDAKNKKKGKGKGKKRDKKTCNRRKPLARLKVSHDGSIVRTPTLENGRRYWLRVSDHVTGTAPLLSPVGIDAGYVFRQGDGEATAKDNWNGVDYGLSVDGEAANWGDYQSNHVYGQKVEGQGQKLALRLVTEPESGFNQSADGDLAAQRIISTPIDLELSGALTVEIFCD
jgi:hypothetical protein